MLKRTLLLTFLASIPAQAASLKISASSTVRLAGEVEGNYSASHVFVDEAAGTSVPFTIFFNPQMTGVETCEVFTNLNRRDRAELDANGDSIEDGIKFPPGSVVTVGSDAHYFKAHTMSLVSGGYQLTLDATKTGAYRLTVRWRLTADAPGTYRYYIDPFGDLCFRAHAIVVSPTTAREMVMYELNTLNIEAEGTTEATRSTFVDLWDGPGSTRTPRWNLNHARGLGVNWLWFQPVHPYGIDGRHLSGADINTRAPGSNATTRVWNLGAPYEDVNYAYALGSPYAVKNFFEVEPRMSKGNTRPAAMTEFQGFVNAADNAGANTMNVMLDAPFNHTAYDCELGEKGVTYFSPAAAPTDEIRNKEARFFSRSANYAMRAFSSGSIALASDRNSFGKFIDTFDIYWGRYASLVATDTPGDNDNHLDEGDWFDFSIGDEGSSGDNNGHFDTITQNVWRYFADYCLHWLEQTGCTTGTSPADQTWKGVDGLRADFAQGMPPQGWEYVINKTRTRKWAFVFMAESLDGGPVTYRSSRHFDVLNEDILFAVRGLNVSSNTMTSDLRGIFESRRTAYGQAPVLLTTLSHDEDSLADPWQSLLRYAVYGTNDGVPMIFSGQELGISTLFGFDLQEKNFGKFIPHFKTWNSMMPAWTNADFGNDQLYPVYAAIGGARRLSPALRSANRYFLDQKVGGTHQRIFSVAKYAAANASPGVSDVVFAFVNLDRDANESGTFNVNITQGGSNLFGIKAARTYNVKNSSAYTAQDATRNSVWLWGAGRTGTDVLGNGVYVGLNRVPGTTGAWTTAPYEAQYLKLYDVTPPPAGGTPATPKAFAIGSQVTFSWTAASDPDGGIAGYQITITGAGGPQVFTLGNVTSFNFTGAEGQVLQASVRAINNAGILGAATPASSGTTLLSAAGDADGDGASNASEDVAGTDPFSTAEVFKVIETERLSASSVRLRWSSVSGVNYEVLASATLDPMSFTVVSGPTPIPATGTTSEFTDTNASVLPRFYKVRVATGP
ncbi:MAG: hypothetical protein ABMA13_06070 [Chthoniobacteraceae bacterium]